ncbi:MAG: RNA pseudouridine synthase, partial [Firmicutes bacterium]|nr:RNA pseudouridine synthase [Bacillota bacterium]
KWASLSYAVVGVSENMSLVRLELHTGRAHQIRVQMAHAGFPLVGDVRYGRRTRQNLQIALWGYELQLIHPTLQEKMTFTAPPPERYPWNMFKEKA